LDLAEKEGIVVEDDRRLGGSVWVRVETPRTAGERRVVRNLLRMGFESWPGKGYWR